MAVIIGGAVQSAVAESGLTLVGSDTTERTMTSATAADLVTITGLTIPATTPFVIVINARKSAAANGPGLGLKINATTVYEAANGAGQLATFPSTNEAQSGTIVCYVGPRRTNYLSNVVTGTQNLGGASAKLTTNVPNNVPTADFPNATVTDVIIRGDSDGSQTLAVHGVFVYTMAVA